MRLGLGIRQQIRSQRRSRFFSALARECEDYLRAWYNEDFYDLERNGEAFALRTLASSLADRPTVFWDIGAHEGEWAMAARRACPRALVHSFEILPPIAERLRLAVAGDPAISVHAVGLSDRVGEKTVHWNQHVDSTNSISPRHGHRLFAEGTVGVVCHCSTIDEMIGTLPSPDALKIDVEGHEAAVLRGARGLLSSEGAPKLIQFEYGQTYLPGRSTLGEVYELLAPNGYWIGRLFPNHVAFKDYEYADDNFRMGNFVATRDSRLKAMLS